MGYWEDIKQVFNDFTLEAWLIVIGCFLALAIALGFWQFITCKIGHCSYVLCMWGHGLCG